jgi:hypothetical protein
VLPLPYLALTGMFTLLRLLPTSSTDKDTEILVLRHQLAILQRPADRASPHPTAHSSPPCYTAFPDQSCDNCT